MARLDEGLTRTIVVSIEAANAIWRIIGEPCGGDWAQETGQVLFDRTGNFGWNQAVLLLADRMQTQGDFWYHFSYGDKDTWGYAFKVLGLPTPTSGRSYSPLGGYIDRNGTRQEQFCGHTMLQVSRCHCVERN
jgi:alpha 1,2-mannosyltransferase